MSKFCIFFFIVYILSKSVLKVLGGQTACEWDIVRKTRQSFPLRGLNLVLFFSAWILGHRLGPTLTSGAFIESVVLG